MEQFEKYLVILGNIANNEISKRSKKLYLYIRKEPKRKRKEVTKTFDGMKEILYTE